MEEAEEQIADHTLPQPTQSHACPIKDMERVVATVTGYHGLERFNLIKLINYAGASYFGSMSKLITHLVCWKFEGRKYEIARMLSIPVVNHCWIEDCIKEGKRLPIDSYTLQSGHEVGPLLLEVPASFGPNSWIKNKVVSDGLCDIESERKNIDLSFGAPSYVLEDSCLMKKYEETSSHSSRRLKKVKRNISCDNEVSTAAGPSRKERKFVKKVDDVVVSDPVILDLSPDDRLCRMDRDRLHTEAAAASSLSGGVDVNDLQENSSGPDARLCNQNRAMNGSSDDTEHITDLNQIEDPQPLEQTSIDLCSSAGKFIDGDQVDNVADSPISNEWSCVICFENFSSTLGVLPCEHKFCLTCIQRWAHQRISMGKISTCPLCKASFAWYKIFEHAATADKELNSQTVPCVNLASGTLFPMDQELPDNSFEDGACVVCRTQGPDDLIETCNVCWTRRIHSYCMDPPTYPWTCTHCKELRMLYRNHPY